MNRNVDVRTTISTILTAVLPKTEGDDWFDSIMCQGRMSDRRHSPDSELCHWVLFELGCRDSRILCRDVPDRGIKYSNNQIEKIVSGAQRLSAWKRFVFENSPMLGDIIHLGSKARGEMEHVRIFLHANEKLWTTAGVTQSNKTGLWTAQETTNRFDGLRLENESGVTGQLNGWVDVCSITYENFPRVQ
jgi:hypothetical protein